SQIPTGIPWIFPVIGHGNDIGIVEMNPFTVAALLPDRRRCRLRGISRYPLLHVIIVELLTPKHTRECLPLYQLFVFHLHATLYLFIKFIGFGYAFLKNGIKIF